MEHLLVVGGGRGASFPDLGPDDIALDISPRAVPHALGTISPTPFRSGAFATRCFERVPYMAFTERSAGVIAEAARILRPGSLLVIETGTRRPDLHAAAGDYAERLCTASAPLAVRAIKQAVKRGLELPLEQAMVLEASFVEHLLRTEDATEGPLAFKERRQPIWRAR